MLNFPDTPTLNQTFQNWQWDGVKWNAAAPPAPRSITLEVHLVTNQTVSSGVWTAVKFDTKITDVQNAYNLATGLFTPTVAGLYLVSATIQPNSTGTTYTGAAIAKNGNVVNAQSQQNEVGGGMASLNPVALIYCNGTTDTISAQGNPGGTGNAFLGTSSGAIFGAIGMVATLL
jgi:hypothetical protein